ncbi:hypothetical protein, partial [Burkholderia sp. AU45388]|uniref:hypothetical protein n=1 Tax=Burkholderia sp. AU45388 TaxID=3059206 RepID=UPI0026572FAC
SQEIQSAELDTGTFDYKRPDLSKHVTMPAFDLDDVPGLGEQYGYTGSHTWSDRDMGEAQLGKGRRGKRYAEKPAAFVAGIGRRRAFRAVLRLNRAAGIVSP